MSTRRRIISVVLVAVLAGIVASAGASDAASKTACAVLPASQASKIIGMSVTTRERPSAISPASSVCMYMVGQRPIVQLGLTVMETEAVAAQNFKIQQKAAAAHKNVANRQKGNVVLSAITMNGDASKLNGLLDAAADNL
jgi:hypothetical protein